MGFKLKLLLIGFVFLCTQSVFSQEIWTIGPMLHVNFGGEKRSTSFAIETAYWNIDRFPYSVDFAIEFDRKVIRLYSEVQTGIALTGISVGPVIEFGNIPRGVRLGIQGTVWANYFIGIDYRLRFFRGNPFHGLGFYGKLPMASSGLSSGPNGSTLDYWDVFD